MYLFTSERLEQHWFFKYKLYHIPLWAGFNLLWGFANMIWLDDFFGNFFSIRFIQFIFYLSIELFVVYFNLYYLIPKYLEKGRLNIYITYLLICLVTAGFLLSSSYYLSSYITGKPLDYFCYLNTDENYFYFFTTTQTLPTVIVISVIAMTIKLSRNWLKAQKRQQALEKEKLETELKFLKYQFNPHFLFNTINSIFFLIHKDPSKASASLAKFSELLRYQLYECNESQIFLDQEIAYLENFVALEKLRRNKDFKIDLDINLQNRGFLGVSPFILLTFVENAFKHVSKHKYQTNWIKIRINITEENNLDFEVVNSKEASNEVTKEAVKYGGIGLKNVKRRLDLIYPEQHNLLIEDKEEVFSVKLQLKLIELSVPHLSQEMPEVVSNFDNL